MMKKDISANLYQKCLILCSKILLNVLHNWSLTVLLSWQHTGFQTSPILKTFLAIFGVPFSYLQMVPHYMIQNAYKYVSLSLWPCLTFSGSKSTDILKSSGWGLEKGELPWEQMFYSGRCVFCKTISLPNFNGLPCKLGKALFTNLIEYWVECMT